MLGLKPKVDGPWLVRLEGSRRELKHGLSVQFRRVTRDGGGPSLLEAQLYYQEKPVSIAYGQEEFATHRLGELGGSEQRRVEGQGNWFPAEGLHSLRDRLSFRLEGSRLQASARVATESPHGDFEESCSLTVDLAGLRGSYREGSSLDTTQ